MNENATLTGGDWLIVALAGLAILAGVHLALRLCGATGLAQLWRGTDGRASTSKFQAVVWTLALAWALLSLLAGEIVSGHESALQAGWAAFLGTADAAGSSFQADYLALLGVPIGTAVAAKAITARHVASGRVVKPPAQQGLDARRQALFLVGNDRGQPSLMDFQLLIFNLLLLAFFAGTFLTEPARGLPDLPETLLALAGASSLGYTINKVNERTAGPAISSVRPSRIVLGPGPVEVEIFGGPFGEKGGKGGVAIEGIPIEISSWATDRIAATVAPQTSPAGPLPIGTGSLVVYDAVGVGSEPSSVEIVHVPAPADPGSDELLAADVLRRLEQEMTQIDAILRDEEDLAAAAPARKDPGTSHLTEEAVRPAGDDDV